MTPETLKKSMEAAVEASKRGETLTPFARVLAARALRDEAEAAARAAYEELRAAIAAFRAGTFTPPGTYWRENDGQMELTNLPEHCECGERAVRWDADGEGFCEEMAQLKATPLSLVESNPDLFKSLSPDEFARRVAALDTPEERAKLETLLLKMPDVPPNGVRL